MSIEFHDDRNAARKAGGSALGSVTFPRVETDALGVGTGERLIAALGFRCDNIGADDRLGLNDESVFESEIPERGSSLCHGGATEVRNVVPMSIRRFPWSLGGVRASNSGDFDWYGTLWSDLALSGGYETRCTLSCFGDIFGDIFGFQDFR